MHGLSKLKGAGECREIEEEDIRTLERRLLQALELSVGKKKRILLARREQARRQGAPRQVHVLGGLKSL